MSCYFTLCLCVYYRDSKELHLLVGSVPAPNSSNNTSELLVILSSILTIFVIWDENVLRLCSILVHHHICKYFIKNSKLWITKSWYMKPWLSHYCKRLTVLCNCFTVPVFRTGCKYCIKVFTNVNISWHYHCFWDLTVGVLPF